MSKPVYARLHALNEMGGVIGAHVIHELGIIPDVWLAPLFET